ncbi:Acyl-N-acyltransferase [Mycena venus]|uniref:Acyl-N-acyltransferase n=1 Tax=Mycena venus TaxID=2733690 RepID=A0A8H7CRS0_9AGAR|nr:Acyl-N-acyltransferase [Mycena venus]
MALMHDVNFCLPIPQELENERVKLVAFAPAEHADAFFTGANESLYTHLPWGPFSTAAEFRASFGPHVNPDPSRLIFAVLDKTTADAPQLAGTIGFMNTLPAHLSTEIGCVITLPRFQRTHVTANGVGLLLHLALDAPAEGGFGLRRVVWQTNALNTASMRAAERLGFRHEGVLRWDHILRPGKAANRVDVPLRAGDPKPDGPGTDTMVYSLCWDDWEGGAREAVDTVMQRTT